MKIQTVLTILILTIILGVISYLIGQLSYSWLPPQASFESHLVDNLFSFLVTIGSFILLGVTGTIIYSVIFHRAGRYDLSDGPPIEGNITLEVVWTTIPFILVFIIAIYSYQTYQEMALRPSSMPIDKTEEVLAQQATIPSMVNVEVEAKQWAWIFRYPDKNVTSTELHLPVNKRAHLVLKSSDVIHGFYIPAFRVKQDVIPRETIDFEFTPIRQGNYRLRDSQYSGTYFAAMQSDVVIESEPDYRNWLTEASKKTPSPSPNQAASEYALRQQQSAQAGWKTIEPAPPPLVNYHP